MRKICLLSLTLASLTAILCACGNTNTATDSENKDDWFYSTWDDDVWRIDTEIANVKWFKDRHFDYENMEHLDYVENKHIVTFEDIKPEALKLVYKGTGKDN